MMDDRGLMIDDEVAVILWTWWIHLIDTTDIRDLIDKTDTKDYHCFMNDVRSCLNEVSNLSRTEDFEICQFSLELFYKIW